MGERKRERECERTNKQFFFINEGNEISTILFYIQPSDKKHTREYYYEREREEEKAKRDEL